MIYGFSHTAKGHWNLLHVPMLPVVGTIAPGNYCSGFSHEKESAHPGYYQVYLERYKVNAELTSTLRVPTINILSARATISHYW